MNFDRGYRFFLKAAFACLVASMFLPFGFDSGLILSEHLGASGDSRPSPFYGYRCFYWSFIVIQKVEVVPSPFPPSALRPIDQDLVGLFVMLLPNYWGLRPNPRIILFLQVSLIILGLITIRRAKSARSIIPFFLGILSLSFLHLSAVSLDVSILSCGLSIFSTIFTYIAIGRAP